IPIQSAFPATLHNSPLQTAFPPSATAHEFPAPVNPCRCRFRPELRPSNPCRPLDRQFRKRGASLPNARSLRQTDLRWPVVGATNRFPAPGKPALVNSQRAGAIHPVQNLSPDNPRLPTATLPPLSWPHPAPIPSTPAQHFLDRVLILES